MSTKMERAAAARIVGELVGLVDAEVLEATEDQRAHLVGSVAALEAVEIEK